MYRYPVFVTMKTGNQLQGIAIDTDINMHEQECIKVIIDDVESLLVLDDIHMLIVQGDNTKFTEIVLHNL